MTPVPPSLGAVLREVDATTGARHRWQRQLRGGERGGAHLLVEDGRSVVLKWEPPGWRADQLVHAFPVVAHATDHGWRAARWLAAGSLVDGGAFVLQEHVRGVPVSRLDVSSVRAVIAANATQSGLATNDAPDDSAHLEAVLSGDHEWKAHVAGFTPAGAALVAHGDEITAWAGRAVIPGSDIVHGDCSSTNILLEPGGAGAVFVDCQTVGRGSRVRDLADLYRQSFVYPGPGNTGADLLRTAAVAVEGPRVFARCAVAVTYDNLAWWVANKPPAAFDQACARLHRLLGSLRRSR